MNMSDVMFVYLAYTVIFLGIAGYIFYLHMKQNDLSRDMELLEDSVKSYGKRKKRTRK